MSALNKIILFHLLGIFVLAGCFASTGGSGRDATKWEVGSDRLIQVGDVLGIQVKGEKDCTGSYAVNAKGEIQFCYVGKMHVAGLDVGATTELLTKNLAKDFLKDPIVTIALGSAAIDEMSLANSVRVIGEVNRPGIYPLKAGYTILDAILEAGNFTEFASANRTKIVRGSGASKKVIVVKMKDLMKTGDQEKNVMLQAGDIVIVPEGLI